MSEDETPPPETGSLRSLDWRLVTVMLMASVLLPFSHTLSRSRALAQLPWVREWNFELVYGALPFLALALLGYRPWRYFRLGRFRAVAPVFLSFVVIVLGSTVWLSGLDSWNRYYSGVALSSVNVAFLVWPLSKMIAGEFFFRGVLVFPLFPRLGWYALPIAAMPYTLFHLNKPDIEIYGSMVFGLGLGYLAVRTGSVWYGIFIHWMLNVAIPVAIGLRS